MEWSNKNPLQWDWVNFGLLNEKESEMSTSTEQSEWRVGGEISNSSVYSLDSGICSGSELPNVSSNNSISTSVVSLINIGNMISEVNLEASDGDLENQIKNKNEEMTLGEDHRISSVIGGCIYTGERPIGLKLGKRTYFENLGSTNFKASPSVSMTSPASSVKRSRASHLAIQHSHCQVEGCNIDLTAAKDYHRKHRVCVSHSKSPRVIVAGHERRFCQQCSRFHDLSEFDQKKRSCRRRLSDHNARRRKPQPETISFKPSRLPAFYVQESSNLNGASDLQRALSLLSNYNWHPSSTAQSNMIQFALKEPVSLPHCPVESVLNSAPECWQDYHSLAEQTLAFDLRDVDGGRVHEFCLDKALFDTPLFQTNQLFYSPTAVFSSPQLK